MTDPDDLRIIATDAKLATPERDLLKQAADDLDELAAELIRTRTLLIDSNDRRIATNDVLIELRKRELARQVEAWRPFELTVRYGWGM